MHEEEEEEDVRTRFKSLKNPVWISLSSYIQHHKVKFTQIRHLSSSCCRAPLLSNYNAQLESYEPRGRAGKVLKDQVETREQFFFAYQHMGTLIKMIR